MSVKVKIKHLKPGTVFNAGPVTVRVLEHFSDGKTLVITDECIAGRPFTCPPFKPNRPEDWKPNNWRTSTLRADLNRDFLSSFDEAGGPILSENIIPAEWDLTDSAGNNTYGSVTDKIGLLTEAMFRKYSEQRLLDLDDWWWLITPDPDNSDTVRLVDTDGTMYHTYAFNGHRGVRPALYVESEIEVEVEEDEVDIPPSILLDRFTTRQLVEELFRRICTKTGVKERYPRMVGEGQEIYFGDVVRLFGGEYFQGYEYYEHDQTIVVKSANDIEAMEESENVQLLGNVWDNPELLKEESV